jgi:spermidine/putrescine-binding protein
MPTIVKLGNIAIRMFADDHNPPHFHIVTPEHQAIVAIDTLVILAGRMDRRSFDTALAWARDNRVLLVDTWEQLNG